MAYSSDAFREAMSALACGVTVVTSVGPDGLPTGVTVTAFASLSLDPPLVTINLGIESRTLTAIRQHRAFVVHILAAHQAGFARHFATRIDNKFEGLAYTTVSAGVPLLEGCPATLHCTLEAEHTGGDHAILVGLVTEARSAENFEGLVYFRRQFLSLEESVPSV
jgi:flavin reductase (DIM6/NTAB) family NADH-FMN oxidoreductase RutF